MAQKNRTQLINESDEFFLDNTSGQIIPANHREFNNDMIASSANLLEPNQFQEEVTFNAAAIFDVQAEFNDGFNVNSGTATFNTTIEANANSGDAIHSVSGNIHLEDGNIQIDNGSFQMTNGDVNIINGAVTLGGSLSVAQNSTLNQAFIRKLQNCFATNAITAYGTLDLISTDGNFIYIEGDTTIDSFNGNIGEIYYAMFTGTCLFDHSIGNIAPPATFRTFPNDILIFAFTSSSTIRVIGLYRASDDINNQINGQNYFQINNPQDALDLAQQNALSIGATYRVLNAYRFPKLGVYWDVFLKAKTTNLFEDTCWVSNLDDNLGVLQKAWFTGDFNDGSILITDTLDAAAGLTYAAAETNTSQMKFALEGSRAYIQDPDVGFYGYLHFAANDWSAQTQNLLDIQNPNAENGRIMVVPTDGNANRWISHSKWGTAGTILFGNKFYNIGLPSLAAINSVMVAQFGSGQTTLSNYRLAYQVVNDICTLNFWATMTASTSVANLFRLLLPTPFFISANNHQGSGTLRFISSNNSDQGLMVENFTANGNYFYITSKHSNTANNVSLQVSGYISFQITT